MDSCICYKQVFFDVVQIMKELKNNKVLRLKKHAESDFPYLKRDKMDGTQINSLNFRNLKLK